MNDILLSSLVIAVIILACFGFMVLTTSIYDQTLFNFCVQQGFFNAGQMTYQCTVIQK
jgi:hypothetical protein